MRVPSSGPDPAVPTDSPGHLVNAASLYGVAAAELSSLGAFESDVYGFDGPGGPAILKVMAPGHRTADQVQAEVDWLLALVEEGVPVAEPLRSRAGNWVETLPETGHVVVAYARAPGANPRPADWTPPMIEQWGGLLGRLQAHARSWTPPGPRRYSLVDQTYLRRLDTLAAEFPAFHAAAGRLLAEAEPLLTGAVGTNADPITDPTTDPVAEAGRDSGLIHADLHHGNLLLHDGLLVAIDFDDCAYGSYAFDLAMPIYYAVRSQRDTSAEKAMEAFVPSFIRGFRRFAPDPAGGAYALDLALRFRQAELVLALRVKVPEDGWTPNLAAIEKDLRQRVENGVPFVQPGVLEGCLAG